MACSYACGVAKLSELFSKVWRLDEQCLVRGEERLCLSLADHNLDDWALQITVRNISPDSSNSCA